ncbi:CaiB/BaiF CoA-transferase family protein [Micromonospora sp. NPDC023814]|uniref:CaiB/BaiF CoA transferase family protein n=1 Tax=Micromonospora sp. NPDC023814 TaxID=3154596 RepID=UPI0033E91273
MTRRSGPLRGLTVVELGGVGPAPFCGMLLADLGARVVQIARPGAAAVFSDAHLRFGVVNRGRESVAIDLSRPEGVAAALRLVDGADAAIEGFRPGVAERIGVGPDACRERNPRLVYGRITGWGHGGPWSDRAGHEANYVGLAGGLAPVSRAGEPAAPPAGQHGDIGAAATFLALGVVSALLEARSSGEGQVVEASVVDSVAARMALAIGAAAARDADRLERDTGVNAPFGDTYRCADGRFVAVAAIEETFYSRLLGRLGLTGHPALVGDRFDRARWPGMRQVLTEVFLARARDEWCEVFADADACVSPVLTVEEATAHEHNRARELYVDVGGSVQPAPTPRFSRTPPAKPSPAVPAGANSTDVLRGAGLSAEEVSALLSSGVVVADATGGDGGCAAT